MNSGGPAFPVLHRIDGNWVKEPRMSLRDYFAAAALSKLNLTINSDSRFAPIANEVAAFVYEIADAMISEREKI